MFFRHGSEHEVASHNFFMYTTDSIKVVTKQRDKVEYEREKLAGSGDKKYTNRTKFSL